MAPWVSMLHNEKAWLEAFHISASAVATRTGKPCPPHSGEFAAPTQPRSAKAHQAAGKPRGVATVPSRRVEPSRSPV